MVLIWYVTTVMFCVKIITYIHMACKYRSGKKRGDAELWWTEGIF